MNKDFKYVGHMFSNIHRCKFLLRQNNPSFPNSQKQCPMEVMLIHEPCKKGVISKMYKKYGAWQNGGNCTELYNKDKTSVCARHDLLLFKVTHCLHWPKQRID